MEACSICGEPNKKLDTVHTKCLSQLQTLCHKFNAVLEINNLYTVPNLRKFITDAKKESNDVKRLKRILATYKFTNIASLQRYIRESKKRDQLEKWRKMEKRAIGADDD
jgi:hypothetical protein